VKVELGAPPFQVTWHVLDAGRYERWLSRRPWLNAEAPFVARVPCREGAAQSVMDGARHLARLYGESVRWAPIEPAGADPLDVNAHLAAWAQVRVTSDRDLAEALGTSLMHVPRIFVVKLSSTREASAWRERCARISELALKMAGTALCFVFALATDDDVDVELPRLDVAWPSTLRRMPTEDDRWASYLHERIAWHVGARVDDAVDVFGSVLALPRGDDAALEQALRDHALGRYVALPSPIRVGLSTSLDVLRADSQLCMPAIVPGSSGAQRPLPWVARALLAAHPKHPQRRFLRAAVTCRPMAMKLLGRCIDMEARIKDAVMDRLIADVPIPSAIREETKRSFERITGTVACIERDLVPPGHPLPEHPWELAALGTVEVASGECPPETRRIRWIRNALAHGAPVSWKAFALVDALEHALGRGPPDRPDR